MRQRRRNRKTRRSFKTLLASALKRPQGRKALKRFKSFWGLKAPCSLRLTADGKQTPVLVSLGRCPCLEIADAPEGKHKRIRRVRMGGYLASNPQGTRLFVIRNLKRGLSKGARKPLGFVAAAEYVPTTAMERAGTFKTGATWHHSFGKDEKGRWPRAWSDKNGNVIFGASTYRVAGRWLQH